jgi:hypothetical protein
MPMPMEQDVSLRPLAWRRMAWVIWRQRRLTLGGIVALLAAAGAYLLIAGLQMHTAYGAVASCRPADAGICQQVAGNFLNTYAPGVGWVLGLLQTIPALIGAFAGAPVLARELETGTFRYAWTQGFGRGRWTLATVASLAVVVTVAAGAFALLVAWYIQPIFDAGDNNGPLSPTLFDLLGVVLAAWTLTAFSIGALAGALVRRVVPAMFATLAAWGAIAFVTGLYLRPHYAAAVVTRSLSIPAQALVISQGWFRGGTPATLDMLNSALARVDVRAVTPGLFQPGPSTRKSR